LSRTQFGTDSEPTRFGTGLESIRNRFGLGFGLDSVWNRFSGLGLEPIRNQFGLDFSMNSVWTRISGLGLEPIRNRLGLELVLQTRNRLGSEKTESKESWTRIRQRESNVWV